MRPSSSPPVPCPQSEAEPVLTVRYFAGARAAAGGTSSETVEAADLDELIQVLVEQHGERLALVLKAASFLVDGLTCHDRAAALPESVTVDILPPFAGG
ncbi:MoaD/ThiS family protein [Actinoplanes lobatus]|uniref:MoaD/ThiS family protein n=1 Tax=Actinoplanes lobatus TaxID=113568 RepID=UPI003898E038